LDRFRPSINNTQQRILASLPQPTSLDVILVLARMIVALVQMIVLVRIIARIALAMMTVGVKIFAKIIVRIETVLAMKIAPGMMTVDAKTTVAVALMVAIKTIVAMMIVHDAMMMTDATVMMGVVVMIDSPRHMLTLHARSARFMGIQLVIAGGVMMIVTMMTEIVETKVQTLPLMAWIATGTMTPVLLNILEVN
jgi:hypothetical protein